MCLFGISGIEHSPKRHISLAARRLWTTPAAKATSASGCGVPSAPLPPHGLRLRVFRGPDAVRAGLLSPDQLRSRAHVRLFRSVYADARLEIDHQVRVEAVGLLLTPGTAIGGRSAAAAAGIKDVAGDRDPVEVIAEPGVVFGPFKGMRIRRALLPDADLLVRAPPRTTLLRAAVDIACEPDLTPAVVALDRILHGGQLAHDSLREAVAGLFRRRGCRSARQAVALADGRSESPPETRTRLILSAAGLAPVPQYEIHVGGSFVARVDLAFVAERVAIEYEGAWHWEPGQLRRDRRRLDGLTAAGWRVVHVTAADLHDPETLLARIRCVLALAAA